MYVCVSVWCVYTVTWITIGGSYKENKCEVTPPTTTPPPLSLSVKTGKRARLSQISQLFSERLFGEESTSKRVCVVCERDTLFQQSFKLYQSSLLVVEGSRAAGTSEQTSTFPRQRVCTHSHALVWMQCLYWVSWVQKHTHQRFPLWPGKTPPVWQQPSPLLPQLASRTHGIHTSKLLLTCKSTLTYHAKHSHLRHCRLRLSFVIIYGQGNSTDVMVCLQHAATPRTHKHTMSRCCHEPPETLRSVNKSL